jgi:GTP diphosphokinase / guanosine-3',5'-bis(diphosphate) 3'-diphosphatase
LLHSLYKPVPERFKDYIAIPKANGYQSLHTTLFGPYGMPIEVQIRTAAMDEQANNGVAAHRLYKAASPGESGLHNQTERWLKTLSELQSSSSSSLEFIESVKVDLFPAEIYVFTPKGRIKELPNESTVIDFAYSVHTDVGNACQSAMVDKKSVPLSTVLHSGQTVEVVTAEDVEPDSSWLEFVVTGKARAAIRHQLKSRHRGQAIYKGREMLKKALSQFILSTPQIDVDSWQQLLDELGLRHRDALYAEMGLGNYAPMLVARRLVGFSEEAYARLQKPSALTELSPSLIEGGEGQVIHYASCCHPIPGDEIVGVLESSGGIVIHRHHCPTLLKRNSRLEQLMHMQWQPNLVGLYTAKLLCKLDEKLGAVAEVVAVVDQYHIELKDLVVIERLAEEVTVMMTLQVENCHQLMAIIDELSELAVVRQVTRS